LTSEEYKQRNLKYTVSQDKKAKAITRLIYSLKVEKSSNDLMDEILNKIFPDHNRNGTRRHLKAKAFELLEVWL